MIRLTVAISLALAGCATTQEDVPLAPRPDEPYCAKLYKRFNEEERVYEWVCIERRPSDRR